MQEKKKESSQANDRETSRRTFLKVGAAAAGADCATGAPPTEQISHSAPALLSAL